MSLLMNQPMPTVAVTVVLTTANCWQTGVGGTNVVMLFAFVATDSVSIVSFVQAQVATRPGDLVRVLSRPSFDSTKTSGVVIEVYLTQGLAPGEAVTVSLAQSGATQYEEPVPIED